MLPFLQIIASGSGMATREVRSKLEETLNLSEEDIQENPSTNYPRWYQIINNLRSNKTLEKRGLARFENRKWYITDLGLEMLIYAKQ